MRDTGGQQSDRTELVGLDQATLQFVAIRDVVEDDQAADLFQVFGNQRRDGDVQGVRRRLRGRRAISAVSVADRRCGQFRRGRVQRELVDVVHADLPAYLVKLLAQVGGKQLGEPMT